MRGCEVLFGVEKAVGVRNLLAASGVPCPCQGEECPGCPIMGDWGQRARLTSTEPVAAEVSRGSAAVAGESAAHGSASSTSSRPRSPERGRFPRCG